MRASAAVSDIARACTVDLPLERSMETALGPAGYFEILGLLVSLVVISYLIGCDAEKRGLSGMMWGLFTFFSCFMAVPIYFLLISNNQKS